MDTMTIEQQKNIFCRKLRISLFCRNQLRFAILKRDGFSCRYCGRTVEDGAKLTVDHIVPVSKGGDYCWQNLITCCEDCNKGKDDALLSSLETERFVCPASIICKI